MNKIRPCGHRVVVKPLEIGEYDKQIASARKLGLIIQEDIRTTVDQGIVVKVGPSAFSDEEPWCKEGDKICFAKYSGKGVEMDGVDYLVLNDDDILCVLEESKDE